jgi:single-stranded-DNA-specific exonuclease
MAMTMTQTKTRWTVKPSSPIVAPGVSPILGTLLSQRGVTAETLDIFLRPSLTSLADPMLMRDMDKAVARIRAAVDAGERVCIYGDYDADGLTAQAILVTAFRHWQMPISWYTPDRRREGYGLNSAALQRLFTEGYTLVIAVDLGISNAAEVALANDYGLDVIVIDHHHIPETIPNAVAVVNPHRADSAYPFHPLCGAGVAFSLVRALAQSGDPFTKPERDTLEQLIGLAAIGTVADVVPLIGENRLLAASGIKALRVTTHPGIRALSKVARLAQERIDSQSIAFALGPRLNAPGRVGDVGMVHDLLYAEELPSAQDAAALIEKANVMRQGETRTMVSDAIAQIDAAGAVPPVVMVGSPDYQPGVVGLVAARMADRYHRPALVYHEGEAGIRGSARSVPGFSVIDAFDQCKELFTSYGGHDMAAGFSVPWENLPALRAFLCAQSSRVLGAAPFRTLELDATLPHSAVNMKMHADIQLLEPFGNANPVPLFLVEGVRPTNVRLMGRDQTHLAFDALLDDGHGVGAVAFGMADRRGDLTTWGRVDLAAELSVNTLRGRPELQLKVHDIHA